MTEEKKPYQQMNETLRVEVVNAQDAETQAQLLRLFRSLDLLHVYWEYVLPSTQAEKSITFAALRNRIWPPWGPDALVIEAVFHICPMGAESVGFVGPFVSPENVGNVGMVCALYKEAFDDVLRQGKTIACIYAREDSVLAHHTLTTSGFQRTEHLYLSEEARYYAYEGSIAEVLDHLGLSKLSSERLLNYEFDESAIARAISFHASLQLGWWQLWHSAARRPELLVVSVPVEDNPPGVQPS